MGSTELVVWIQERMRERRLSLRGVAVRSGVDHTKIYRILQGKHQPSLATASRLVNGLGGSLRIELPQ
jgi:transcriptional regulator with XRE-family HTH domain